MKKYLILVCLVLMLASLSYAEIVYEKEGNNLKTTETKEVITIENETLSELNTEKARLEQYIADNLEGFNTKDAELKAELIIINIKIAEANKLNLVKLYQL